MKTGMRVHLHNIPYTGDVHAVYMAMCRDGVRWYNDQDKWPANSDRFKCDLLHAMYTHPSSTPHWKEFVAEKMAPFV